MTCEEGNHASRPMIEELAALEAAHQAQVEFARLWLREIDPRTEPALIFQLKNVDE